MGSSNALLMALAISLGDFSAKSGTLREFIKFDDFLLAPLSLLISFHHSLIVIVIIVVVVFIVMTMITKWSASSFNASDDGLTLSLLEVPNGTLGFDSV